MRSNATLIVAPYIGEFGWELMNWQARVRKIARQKIFSRVILCASPDRELLYSWPELAQKSVFCPMSLADVPGHANDDSRVDEQGKQIDHVLLRSLLQAKIEEACTQHGTWKPRAHILFPEFRSRLWPTHKRWQQFAPLGEQSRIETDIVLVPRTRIHAAQRNLSSLWWQELAGALQLEGLKVRFYPEGSSSLPSAIRLLNSSRLAIGASTGGLHLASLCRCPHLVWGSGRTQRWTSYGMTNRQRYETIWNPLGTPCLYDECGWQPNIAHVVQATVSALDQIGRDDTQSQIPWSMNARWRVRRALGRLMETRTTFPGVPWRLRYLVREHLV